MRRQLESRSIDVGRAALELRADGDTVQFRGYATSYDFWYPVAGGPEFGGWMESVEPGAGRRTLNARPDVRLLINHDGLPLARTRSGTLTLEEDDRGLFGAAPLDLRNPRVQELQSTMDRGDVDEMSFAFRVTRQEWNSDYTERRILEFDLHVQGSDISIVTYPANPATVAQLRSAAGLDDIAPRGMSLDLARAYRAQISAHR